MVQLGGVICDISIFGNSLSNLATKGIDIARDLAKDFLDKEIDHFDKKYLTGKGSRLTLTNNEIKYIIKVIRSLENRRIFLKELLTKLLFKKEGFSIFLGHQ